MESASAIAAEKELARVIEAGNEADVLAYLSSPKAQEVEFTGRCLSNAIAQGMEQAACLMGAAGFHLNVVCDSAAREAISRSEGMRGLLDFLGSYRYCKAQRSYYLPVVESDASCKPIARMLSEGWLSEDDKTELLSLSIRSNNAALTCILADHGTLLAQDTVTNIPADLARKSSVATQTQAELWAQHATPQRTPETLEIVLEHAGNTPCSIRRSWWGSYQRQDGFAAKLSAIACRSDEDHCDCTGLLLETLAREGEDKGLASVAQWEHLDPAWIDSALAAAQRHGKTQAAAILLGAAQSNADELGFLEL